MMQTQFENGNYVSRDLYENEKQCRNEAFAFIMNEGLFPKFAQFSADFHKRKMYAMAEDTPTEDYLYVEETFKHLKK